MAGSNEAYDLGGKSAYVTYDVDNITSVSSGLLVLPVASETAETVTVRVHGGMGKRVVKFDIAKKGNPPVIPLPADTASDTLVNSQVNVITPHPDDTTGSYNWAIQGTYEYVTTGTLRQFGVDQIPVTGYPYSNPRQDALAGDAIANFGDPVSMEQQMIQSAAVPQGNWIWPLTVYPSNMLMNPNLIQ